MFAPSTSFCRSTGASGGALCVGWSTHLESAFDTAVAALGHQGPRLTGKALECLPEFLGRVQPESLRLAAARAEGIRMSVVGIRLGLAGRAPSLPPQSTICQPQSGGLPKRWPESSKSRSQLFTWLLICLASVCRTTRHEAFTGVHRIATKKIAELMNPDRRLKRLAI